MITIKEEQAFKNVRSNFSQQERFNPCNLFNRPNLCLEPDCTVRTLLWITAINVSPLDLTACLALQYFTIFIPFLVHPLNHRFHRFYEQKFK